MTKKDFELIAAALKEARNHWLAAPAIIQTAEAFRYGLEAAASELAHALASDNSRFDRARFLIDCGMNS